MDPAKRQIFRDASGQIFSLILRPCRLYLYLLSHCHVPHPHEVKDDKHMSHSATIGVLAHHESIEDMNQSDGGQEDNEDSY